MKKLAAFTIMLASVSFAISAAPHPEITGVAN
jgi:hypothetical protein